MGAGRFVGALAIGLVAFACSASDGGSPSGAAIDSGTSPVPGDDDSSGDDSANDGGSSSKEGGAFEPAAHPTYPRVPSNGGVMHDPKIVTIVSTGDAMASALLDFGDALAASTWWKTVGADYAIGTPSAHVRITGAALPSLVTQAQMEAYITTSIAARADAQPDGNTIYVLYLPKTTNDVSPANGNTNDANCSEQYGGYHEPFGTKGDAWGLVRRCPLAGTGLSELQQLTKGASHEIIESATDPSDRGFRFGPATTHADVWEDVSGGGEVADLRNSETTTEGLYTFTRVWSNRAATSEVDPCVPAITPYFSAEPANPTSDGWYEAAAGTATIPIIGFSTAKSGDWYEYAFSDDPSVTAIVTSAKSTQVKGAKIAYLNNGVAGSLIVSGGAKGASVLVMLTSQSTLAERQHLFPIGIRF